MPLFEIVGVTYTNMTYYVVNCLFCLWKRW